MSSFEGKFDIKPIKEEMDKIMEVDHECSKRYFKFITFVFKEGKEEDMVSLVKKKLHEKIPIQTTCL